MLKNNKGIDGIEGKNGKMERWITQHSSIPIFQNNYGLS